LSTAPLMAFWSVSNDAISGEMVEIVSDGPSAMPCRPRKTGPPQLVFAGDCAVVAVGGSVPGTGVGGALVGGLWAADVAVDCVTVGDSALVGASCVDDAGSLGELLALMLAEPLAALAAETADAGEVRPAAESEVGAADGVDPVQAETATQTSIAMVLQPTTVSLVLRPLLVIAARTFMTSPYVSNRWQPFPGVQHQDCVLGSGDVINCCVGSEDRFRDSDC
jgi:hypothetical protein